MARRLPKEARVQRDAWMRILRREGWTLRQIAADFQCSRETVREACDPALKARRNAERAAHNTSPEGLQRQREYRARLRFAGRKRTQSYRPA